MILIEPGELRGSAPQYFIFKAHHDGTCYLADEKEVYHRIRIVRKTKPDWETRLDVMLIWRATGREEAAARRYHGWRDDPSFRGLDWDGEAQAVAAVRYQHDIEDIHFGLPGEAIVSGRDWLDGGRPEEADP